MKSLRFTTLFLIYVGLYLIIGLIVFWSDGKNSLQNIMSTIHKQKISSSKQIEPLSLNKIFNSNHNWIESLDKKKLRVLIATGDVIPARSVNFKTVTQNYFTWPFEKTANELKKADITFINLESPLIKNCPVTVEGMVFCGNEQNVTGLVHAGVDVASLANNHAGNYGDEGVINTINLLNNNDILTTGVNGPVYKNVRGLTFAFLGYNDISSPQPGISNTDEEKIKKEIGKAKKKADIVVASFHWGTEYQSQPDKRQINLGHLAIDAGADLIIGNHPHWIQPIEFYKGKLITYAHGNFIFDQMWSEETKKGVLGRYTFFDDKLVDVEFLPVYIKDYGQPYFLTNNGKDAVLKQMKQESLKLADLFTQQ